MTYPTEWKTFWDWQRDNKIHKRYALPKGVTQGRIAKFGAKYHLASGFEGIIADEYKTSETVDAYSAVLKVFLAYTSLEQLCKVVRPDLKKPYMIMDWAYESYPELASEPVDILRESERILAFLTNNVCDALAKRLKSFAAGEIDNCMPVAAAVRHAVAHGFISIRPYGTSAPVATDFCGYLSTMLMTVTDEAFTTFIDDLPKYVKVA